MKKKSTDNKIPTVRSLATLINTNIFTHIYNTLYYIKLEILFGGIRLSLFDELIKIKKMSLSKFNKLII